jgi:hypothetical protein
LQWLQVTSEINGDNLNNVRCEASRYFWDKKREYLKEKINEHATNSKNKNITDLYRGINEFKRGYQPRNNLVKDENCDVLGVQFLTEQEIFLYPTVSISAVGATEPPVQ